MMGLKLVGWDKVLGVGEVKEKPERQAARREL